MPIKVVLPDPPFFDTVKLEKLCREQKIGLTVYRDLALDAEQLQARIEDADIIVVDVLSNYNKQSLSCCKKLRYLVTASVGMNHIDLDYCRQRGIEVSNFTQYNSRAVAEMAFANLISLLRHIPYANLTVRSSLWLTDYFEGEELKGKKLGIVGAGNIGRELIKIGLGFGMDILCHTKHPSDDRATTLGISRFYALKEVLEKSDFIILVATADTETERIINESSLALIPTHSYLINMSRASLVDHHALANALHKKHIAGAALDFVGPEPYSLYDDDLVIQEMVNRPNVMVTPHIGFNTKEAMIRLASDVSERVEIILNKS
jgi:phosphoglycerate dehydrogenase-like enzyme